VGAREEGPKKCPFFPGECAHVRRRLYAVCAALCAGTVYRALWCVKKTSDSVEKVVGAWRNIVSLYRFL
jgi:hypothetical protein